jgi:hypothetical protein
MNIAGGVATFNGCCSRCDFWQDFGEHGRCRRHPPVANPTNPTSPAWPMTARNDKCGEFQDKDDKYTDWGPR